jgi:hypothetical protein
VFPTHCPQSHSCPSPFPDCNRSGHIHWARYRQDDLSSDEPTPRLWLPLNTPQVPRLLFDASQPPLLSGVTGPLILLERSLLVARTECQARSRQTEALKLINCYHSLFFADAYSVPTNMGIWRRRCVRLARHSCPKCLSCLSESECGAVNGKGAR